MKTKEELIKLGIDGFKADEIVLLEEKMLTQAVRFTFRKKDGTIREALGTLMRSLMRLDNGKLWEPVGVVKPEPENIVRYFDLEKLMWRSFTCTEFIAITEV